MAKLTKRRANGARIADIRAAAEERELPSGVVHEEEDDEDGVQLFFEDGDAGGRGAEEEEAGPSGLAGICLSDLPEEDVGTPGGGSEGEEEEDVGYEGGERGDGPTADRGGDEEEEEDEDDEEGGEEEEEEEDEEEDEEGQALGDIGRALLGYIAVRDGPRAEWEKSRNRVAVADRGAETEGGVPSAQGDGGGAGAEAGVSGRPAAEESDSSEDERPSRNTVGNVPLEWYKGEEHIGYDRSGRKIVRAARTRDELDAFLARSDGDKDWRKVYDEYNDEEVELTREEVSMIRRIREGRTPHAEINPYEPYVDWFEYEDKGHPLSSAPEPKRRFIPSKWEAKAVVKLVRAMRKGWIKLDKPKEAPRFYLLWGGDLKTAQKTANGLTYIPPPKPKLPGHDESYNPPVEYLPTEEEVKGYELMYEEDRPRFIPQRFDSLRQVPAYANFIREQFERCLDLYLCPRTRKKRINIDPESLIPKLPKPRDLQPFPTTLAVEYLGHTGPVVALSPDPSGQWLASGSADGTVRLWEVQRGRCRKVWELGSRIRHVAWNPAAHLAILAVSLEKDVLLLPMETGTLEESEEVRRLLSVKPANAAAATAADAPLATWQRDAPLGGMRLAHRHAVHAATWHHKGDYLCSLAPDGVTRSVLVHQLSKQATQNPFRKSHGRVTCVLFHPSRPFLYVATKTHVRAYNLAKQVLARKLTAGVKHIASMAVHPAGDNLLVGSQDMRVLWFDMDLSVKPYRILRNHASAVRAVAFHRSYPLFASCSDDGTAHVFHGMVYADLLQNPLIVPVKILRGHRAVNQEGILDCAFHPTQPWLFTAGADASIKLFSH